MIIHIAGQPGSGKTTIYNYINDLGYKHVIAYDLDDITLPIFEESKISSTEASMVKKFQTKYEKLITNALAKKAKIIIIVGIVNCFTTKSKKSIDFHLENTKYPPNERYFIDSNFGTLINQIKKRLCQDDVGLSKNNYLLKNYYGRVVEHKSLARNIVVGGSSSPHAYDKDLLFVKKIKDETTIDNKYYISERKYVPKTQYELIVYLSKLINNQTTPNSAPKLFVLPEILEIIIPYSVSSLHVFISFIEEKYPAYTIIDAYDSIYNQTGKLNYSMIPNKTIILSRPLLIINNGIQSIDTKQESLPNSYLKVTIECCSDTKYNNICKKTNIDKILYKNPITSEVTTTANIEYNNDIDLLSSEFIKHETISASYSFYNIPKFIEHLCLI